MTLCTQKGSIVP